MEWARSMAAGSGVDIDAHPHIGLSTVTYLFEGRMIHRDSTGAVATIEPGAVNWMTSGRGVAHTERSLDEDRPHERTMSGLQTWVALPADAEETAPSFEHTPADAIPTALAAFNIGIEAGQLVIVALLAGLALLAKALPSLDRIPASRLRPALGYAIGTLAATWLWQRLELWSVL